MNGILLTIFKYAITSAVIVAAGVSCDVTYRAANNPLVDRLIGRLRGDQGARILLRRYADHVVRLAHPEAEVDIDYPEDLLELHSDDDGDRPGRSEDAAGDGGNPRFRRTVQSVDRAARSRS